MRRPGVPIPSRPPSFNDLERAKQSYRGTLGLSSLRDSFRYVVIHTERHCLSAAASVSTSVKPISIWFFEPRLHMQCQSTGNRQQVGSTHVLPTFVRVASPHYNLIDGP